MTEEPMYKLLIKSKKLLLNSCRQVTCNDCYDVSHFKVRRYHFGKSETCMFLYFVIISFTQTINSFKLLINT